MKQKSFLKYTDKSQPCWIWNGRITTAGYGQVFSVETNEYLKQKPIAWENANRIIANLPAEAEKLVRVVEAAKAHEIANRHTFDGELEHPVYCEICNAIRDLRGEK